MSQLTSLNRVFDGIARFPDLTTLRRATDGIARLPDLTTLRRATDGIARLPDLTTLRRATDGIARSPGLTALSRTMDGIARSPGLTALSRTMDGIARSPGLTALSRTMDGIARSPGLTALSRTMDGIARSPGLTALSRTMDGIARSPGLTALLRHNTLEMLAPLRERARFEEADWFPHSTFPRHLLDRDDDEAYSDEIVLAYYRDNWGSVSDVIEKELSGCHVDEDAKETVRQALVAHENGLYRLVAQPLFSAIERAVRVCLCGEGVGRISVKDQLVNLVGRLPASAIPGGASAFVGFTQLSHHLYENVHTNDARERFLDASIPNRHAAIHGLVNYASEKSSLNAIFVAMYVFRILTVLKLRYLRSS